MGLDGTNPVFKVSDKSPQLHRLSRENQNFACSKFRIDPFQNANDKGADQSARMRRLVCVFVVRKPSKTGFHALRPT